MKRKVIKGAIYVLASFIWAWGKLVLAFKGLVLALCCVAAAAVIIPLSLILIVAYVIQKAIDGLSRLFRRRH